MIYSYGISLQGTYHIKKDLVCQDAHKIIKCSDSLAIAAVADGLGSSAHSDVASKIAAETSTEYCAERIKDDYSEEQILEMIKESFALSQSKIERFASDKDHEFNEYDTTLTLAILKDGNLYYGQSGDSGIVALTTEGLYEKVTKQQRDEEGRVFPLFFGEEKWVFGKYPEAVVSVFLATDGMYEILFPVYIRNEPISIYVALARFFMGPDFLHIDEVGEEYVRNKIEEFMNGIPDAQVNDDKTVVVLIDSSIEMKKQDEEYYAEPDWASLRQKYEEAWRKEAYPHLFNEEKSEEEKSTNNIDKDLKN